MAALYSPELTIDHHDARAENKSRFQPARASTWRDHALTMDGVGEWATLKDDGSFWPDQSYFNYATGLTMTSQKLHDLLGGTPRGS
jgi:hypothetical protein